MLTRHVFLILLVSVVVGILLYLAIYFFVPSGSQGRGPGGGTFRYAWAPFVAVPVTFSIGLAVYMVLFPEIKQNPPEKIVSSENHQTLDAVMRVLKDDERKVVELILTSGGSMLQRDIARQTGFSRVKTHRILYRLSTRGIIVAEKHYNTYKITVSDWLFPKKI